MKLAEEVQGLVAMGERGWIHSLRLLAEALDKREMELERIRVHVGFGYDWSPAYDRTQKAPPATSVKWVDKFGALNGMGGVAPFLQELAGGLDCVEEKLREATEHLSEPEKRRPGRPTNAERAARDAAA